MRRSVRLAGFDYSGPATYLVTLVTHGRIPLFGTITNAEMSLSPAGEIVQEEWLRSSELRRSILLDAFVVMPDHFHAIVTFLGGGMRPPVEIERGAHRGTPLHRPARSLGSLIAQFKASSTVRIRAIMPSLLNPQCARRPRRIWQRSFYESILRDAAAIERSRRYVELNQRRWKGTHRQDVIWG
jgi:REP element-mobilizing transposase RayT